MRAFVIAGTHSGCGKTTITLGLLAALARRGLKVQPFKTGPDFIDSGLHRLATGTVSRNLDLWMCGEAYVRSCFAGHAAGSDVAVVEGVMGLYDGELSTAALARTLDLPVFLVVDAYGMAESAGAVVEGFRNWGAQKGIDVRLGGVIFNRVASLRHYDRLKKSVSAVPVLGYLPRDLRFEIPHRHLGLVVAEEQPVSDKSLNSLAETIEKYVDIEGLLSAAACPALSSHSVIAAEDANESPSRPVRIAVAFDRAFCFYYQDNLDLLTESGAEICPFSPLSDHSLPEAIDAVYLGGGYPELYGAELSQNLRMRTAIRGWADRGGTIYGECGGFMYLCKALTDLDGKRFVMTGVFPYQTEMVQGRAHLGYREIALLEDSPIGPQGSIARGHEFHYSRVKQGQDKKTAAIYRLLDGAGTEIGREGYRVKNVLGSYTHLHFGSNPLVAKHLVTFAQETSKVMSSHAVRISLGR